MKYKYLAINGHEVEAETRATTREALLDGFCSVDITRTMTPVVEIDGEPYWNEKTAWGNFTKEQWVKKMCPVLVKEDKRHERQMAKRHKQLIGA